MAGIMLVAFASRALIAPGFMPASGRPFSIEICPEGLSAEVLARVEPSHSMDHADSMAMESMGMDSMAADGSMHREPAGSSHHHRGNPSQSEHCVFGTSCSAGPMSHLPLPSDFSSSREFRAATFASLAAAVRVVHLPQPRAPPSRLS
jgi:hypothetical protein